MTRKDYIGIADVIKKFAYTLTEADMELIATALADYFKAENPRGFDKELFIKNCTGDNTK